MKHDDIDPIVDGRGGGRVKAKRIRRKPNLNDALLDAVKDEIDEALQLPSEGTPPSRRRVQIHLDAARELISYIELHYVDAFTRTLEESERR